MLGYLCAYYRYYNPIEFITAFLNDAANDDDIQNGSLLAKQRGIRIIQPKFGFSKSDYFFNKEENVISKGVASVKYMSAQAADELYELSQSNTYNSFVDLLIDIKNKTTLKSNQLDILIKIDYFSDFGNQRELFAINNIFQMFLANDGKGWRKKIKKSNVDGTEFEDIIRRYSTGLTKTGKDAADYTLIDPDAIVHGLEAKIMAAGLEDVGLMMKVKNFNDIMGHAGFMTGKDTDRNKLFVTAVYPVKRKRDGVVFGYSILYQSVGNGKEGRMTCFKKRFEQEPIAKGDLIICKRWDRDGAYFQMLDYEHIYA